MAQNLRQPLGGDLARSARTGGIVDEAHFFLVTEEQHDNSLVRSWNVTAREEDLLLLQPSTDGFHSPLLVRELARFELGVDEVAVNAELKAAAARWDELQCPDLLLVRSQKPARQTDGLWLVISHRTVLEFNLHVLSLLTKKVSGPFLAPTALRGQKRCQDPFWPPPHLSISARNRRAKKGPDTFFGLVYTTIVRARTWSFKSAVLAPICGGACLYQPRIRPRLLSAAHEKIRRSAPYYHCGVGQTWFF
jgi:hypothetical protein